jgi:hypothetical protein
MVPAGCDGFEQTPLVGSQAPSVWHGPGAAQVTVLAGVQVPIWQESASVHALLSLHGVPLATGGFRQMPVDGSHVPELWHWSAAVQVTGAPGWQVPAVQTSPCVHVLPSLHDVPFETAGLEQVPVVGSQTPATWHWSAA